MTLGANLSSNNLATFRVWAPKAKNIYLKIQSPKRNEIKMKYLQDGLFEAALDYAVEGIHYAYKLNDGRDLPDPLSRFQPEGIHGSSEIVNPNYFRWQDDNWTGLPLEDLIIYEMHVGTFTHEGTFEAIIPLIGYLKDELEVTAIELMPVAQFPEARNWGYDGVGLYAPQNSYGGPQGLKMLVNECHKKKLAVILDVVYNHLGPEGNYIGEFAPYFTNRYSTPWGSAFNYDNSECHWVRRFVIENALYWITEYHIDALRLDAIHGIFDFSAKHILEEMAEYVHAQADALNRQVHLIAESALNDPRITRTPERCGYGINAQWLDDYHHSIHVLLTGENIGYYADFGELSHLAKSIKEGFVYTGQYSRYRKKPFGASSVDLPSSKFVVFSQNHDQVGNRAFGERLCHLVPFEAQKLAAATVIFSPYLPLIFMGEEYAEKAPFLYFTSHSDPELAKNVRIGRKKEFESFEWKGEIPDPQDPATFEHSKVNIKLRFENKHSQLFKCYKDMIAIRKEHPALRNYNRQHLKVETLGDKVLTIERRKPESEIVIILLSFNEKEAVIRKKFPKGEWSLIFDSNSEAYGGSDSGKLPENFHCEANNIMLTLSPYSVLLYCHKLS